MNRKLEAPTLRAMRRLMPTFAVTYHQARRLAERQATRLARTWQAEAYAIRESDIMALTRLTVVRDESAATVTGCDVSGCCRYENGRWMIWLDPTETSARQRFTLVHELKHIIDAGCAVEKVYKQLTAEQIEAVCDHFASCLLMSRPAVYHLWGDGLRTPEALAMACHVSVKAMRHRLIELGLPTDVDEPSRFDYADVIVDPTETDSRTDQFSSPLPAGAQS